MTAVFDRSAANGRDRRALALVLTLSGVREGAIVLGTVASDVEAG
jgi:hypothetical protein